MKQKETNVRTLLFKSIKPRLMQSQTPKKTLQFLLYFLTRENCNFKKLTTFFPLMIFFKRKHGIVFSVGILQTIMKIFQSVKMILDRLKAFHYVGTNLLKHKSSEDGFGEIAGKTLANQIKILDTDAVIKEGYEMMYKDLGGEEEVMLMLEAEKRKLAATLFPGLDFEGEIFPSKEFCLDIENKN